MPKLKTRWHWKSLVAMVAAAAVFGAVIWQLVGAVAPRVQPLALLGGVIVGLMLPGLWPWQLFDLYWTDE